MAVSIAPHAERAGSRWPVALMCLLSTLLLGAGMGSHTVPLLIGTLLLLGLVIGVSRLPQPQTWHAILLAVPFLFWWHFGVDRGASELRHVPVMLLLVVGLYLMALAAHHILAWRRGGSLDYAAACAIMALGMAGVAPANPLYNPLLTVFICLLLLHLRTRIIALRTARPTEVPWTRYAAALLALLAATLFLQVYVIERIPELDNWMVRHLAVVSDAHRAGFSSRSELDAVSEVWDRGDDREVALRVFRKDGAGGGPSSGIGASLYLRAAVYDHYERGAWQEVKMNRPLDQRGTLNGRYRYNAEDRPGGNPLATVYPASEFADNFFLPMGVHEVASFSQRAWASEARTLRPEEGKAAGGFTYFEPTVEQPEPEDRHLELPRDTAPQLRRIARRIMGQARFPQQKIERLRKHFRDQFEYSLQVRLNRRRDPIIAFLTEARRGYCEYFASAATLLLRAEGVPTRYATGFVCREQGMGGLHLARRKDAHAWVEAWIDGHGWQTIEVTPPAPRHQQHRAEGFDGLNQWVQAQWNRLTSVVLHGGAAPIQRWLLLLIGRTPMILWSGLIALACLLLLGGSLARRWRRTNHADDPANADPEIRHLRAMLAEAEAMLRRHGLVRRPATPVGTLRQQIHESDDLPQEVRTRAETLLEEYQRRRFRPPRDNDR